MTDTVNYLLACLTEECAEVSKETMKALIFGLDDVGPDNRVSNRINIRDEIIDIKAIIELLEEENIIASTDDRKKIEKKKERVKWWLEYANKNNSN